MRIIVKDLLPGGQYNLQFRSKNGDDVSEWSNTYRVLISTETSVPEAPTNVQLESVGDSFRAKWNAVTLSTDGSPATDLAGYVVRFRNTVTNQTVDFETPDTSFELTYNLNFAAFTPIAGKVGVKIAAKNNMQNLSEWSEEVIAQNPPPGPVKNLVATGQIDSISATWDAPDNLEGDFKEYRVYAATSSGFTPSPANMVWSGVGTTAIYYTTTNADWYIKVVAVDKFDGASTPVTAGPVRPRSSAEVDVDAPDTPTNLDGSISGYNLNVTWTAPANPDNDLAGYQIGYRPVGQTGWSFATASHEDTSVVIQPIERFKDYQIRIQSHDFSFNYSNWSAIKTVEGEENVAPAVPTGLVMRAGVTTASLYWDRSLEPDFKEFEVQFKANSAPTDTDPVRIVTGTVVTFAEEITEETTYYARIRAVDQEGLKSDWSAVVSGFVGINIPIWAIDDGELESRLNQAEEDIDNASEWITLTGSDLTTRIGAAENDINVADDRLQTAEQALSTAFPSGAFSVEDRLAQTVKNSVVQYAVNSSETVAPTSGWSTDTPTRTPGTFVWYRTVITYGNDNTSTSSPALLTGNTGAPGSQGVSVTSVTPFYRSVTKGAAAPAKPSGTGDPAGWSTVEPAFAANTELYRTERILYSNTTATWTPVTKIASYAGIDAAMQAANSKNVNTYTDIARGATIPSPPSVTGRIAGDVHRVRYTDNGEIAREWILKSGSPNTWQQVTFGDSILTSLDVGKLTSGTAVIDTGVINKMSTQLASIIKADITNLTVTDTATIDSGVINRLWTDVVRSRQITTDMLTVGAGDNAIVDPYFEADTIKSARAWHTDMAGGWGRNANLNVNWYGGTGQDTARTKNFYFDSTTGAYTKESFIPVEPGQVWRFKVKVNNTLGSSRLTARIIRGDGSLAHIAVNTYDGLTGIRDIEYHWTVPNDVNYVMPAVQFSAEATACYVYGGASFTRATDSSLIVDGGITARHLNADDVWANFIRSRKITTDMLVVGQGDNLMADLTSPNAWALSPTVQITTAAHSNFRDTHNLAFTEPNVWHSAVSNIGYPVTPGDQLLLRYRVRKPQATGKASIRLLFYDRNETLVQRLYLATVTPLDWGISMREDTAAVHELASSVRVEVVVSEGSAGDSMVYVGDMRLLRKAGSSLIVDGAVEARSIKAGAINTDHFTSGTIDGDIIKAGTLDADVLTSGSSFTTNLTVASTFTLGNASTNGVIQSHGYNASQGVRIDKSGIIVNSGSISASTLNLQVGSNLMPPEYSDFELNPAYYGPGISTAGGSASNSYSIINGGRFNSQALSIRAAAGNAMRFRLAPSPTGYNVPVEEGKTYIVSAYIKGGPVTSAFSWLMEYNNGTNSSRTDISIPANSNWTRYSQTFTVPTGVSMMLVSIYCTFNGLNQGYDVDGVQVEEKIANVDTPSPWSPGGSSTINGHMIRTGEIRSNTNIVVNGVSQPMWSINTNGGMQIGSAVIRGNLTVGGSGTESQSNIQSYNYSPGNSGFLLRGSDGYAEFQNIKINMSTASGSLVAGNPVGERVEISGGVIKSFTDTAIGLTPTITIGGTEDAFRLLDSTGAYIGGIQSDASMKTPELDADVIRLDGNDLAEQINLLPQGQLMYANEYTTMVGPYAGKTGVYEFPVDVIGGRTYIIQTAFRGRQRGSRYLQYGMNYTFSTGSPTAPRINSTQLSSIRIKDVPNNADSIFADIPDWFVYEPSQSGTARFLFWIDTGDTGSDGVEGRSFRFLVTDAGTSSENVGRPSLGGASGAPPPTEAPPPKKYVKEYYFDNHEVWTQYGRGDTYAPQWVRSGKHSSFSSYYRTYLVLPSAARSALAGASSVSKIEIRLSQTSGFAGRPWTGTILTTNITTSEPTIYDAAQSGTSYNTGQTKWMTLSTAQRNRLAGSGVGIVVGRGGTIAVTNQDFYGTSASASVRPKVRITYYA